MNLQEGYGYQVATEFYSLGIDKLVSHPMSVQAFEQAGNVYVYVRDMTIMGDISVSQRDLYISGSVCLLYTSCF